MKQVLTIKIYRAALVLGCMLALSGQSALKQVDPLTVEVELEDAERFVELFRETEGKPTAEQLQARYIAEGGRAIEIFTPGRIGDAERLARVVSARNELYADAIDRCLPLVRQTETDLRSIYLGFRGLLPEMPLPRISVLFGAANSGGTADDDMQVLGLEVLCRFADDEASFRAMMRQFYAHETVHTLQRLDWDNFGEDALLAGVIAEGTADYIAWLITGEVPMPERDSWARSNEEMLWREFANDLRIVRDQEASDEEKEAAYFRWIGNASSPPEGWHPEAGYWIGMRIAQGCVENAPDRHAAIRRLFVFDDADEILGRSGLTLPN